MAPATANSTPPNAANSTADKVYQTAYSRSLPIKKYDAEPLTRSDLQHNLLTHIFSDQTRCFTNPRPSTISDKVPNYSASPLFPYGSSLNCSRRSDETPEELQSWKRDYENWIQSQQLADHQAQGEERLKPGCKYLTFKELYLESILNSTRCTKNLKEKLLADDQFAEDFAKVCLLVNLGKMNTTLAFYPEMKTILRSYHPIPSLQRNNENSQKTLQDAPRLKTVLKSSFLVHEEPPPTSTRSGIINANANVDLKDKTSNANLDGKDKRSRSRKAAFQNAQENNITLQQVPNTLDELFDKFNQKKAGEEKEPVTGICTLLFILSSCPEEITALHFDNEKKKKKKEDQVEWQDSEEEEFLTDSEGLPRQEIEKEGEDFLSIFYPRKDSHLSSKSRARSFLWLVWNYYEGFNRLPFLSRDLIQSNPFNDSHSSKSESEVLDYFNHSLDEKQREELIVSQKGRWKGLSNPQGIHWLKSNLPNPSINTANKSSATIAKETHAMSLNDVDSLISLIEKEASPSIMYETGPPSKFGPPPPLFRKRLLAPKFQRIDRETWERENVDTEEEIKWGNEMKEERNRFLVEFAGMEQKKVAEKEVSRSETPGNPTIASQPQDSKRAEPSSKDLGLAPKPQHEEEEDELLSENDSPAPTNQAQAGQKWSSIAVSSQGKRKAPNSNHESETERKLLKRLPVGNSTYPLANILAKAHGVSKGIEMDHNNDSSQIRDQIENGNRNKGIDFDVDTPGNQYLFDPTQRDSNLKKLWALDLSYPKTIEISRDHPIHSHHHHHHHHHHPVKDGNQISTPTSNKSLTLLHLNSDSSDPSPSLPAQAWNRILSRASRGVGDASYESDDENVALDDALDANPRGEISRILRTLRCLRGVEALQNQNQNQSQKQNQNQNQTKEAQDRDRGRDGDGGEEKRSEPRIKSEMELD